uniref:Uncharacterized protein n=1 Tax=Plectus sambesii TaxID=2011161 RepID=A0A914VKK2_9BILA
MSDKTMMEKTKDALCDAAEYTKECAESAKDAVFGKSGEDKAADKVKDAADATADAIGDARKKVGDTVKGNN